jgi:D-alanyl-D-alanine dipeptidase
MVNLIKLIPGLVLDLKYATKNNFMHQKLYPSVHTTFLEFDTVLEKIFWNALFMRD